MAARGARKSLRRINSRAAEIPQQRQNASVGLEAHPLTRKDESCHQLSPSNLAKALSFNSAPLFVPIPHIIIFQYNPETLSRTGMRKPSDDSKERRSRARGPYPSAKSRESFSRPGTGAPPTISKSLALSANHLSPERRRIAALGAHLPSKR